MSGDTRGADHSPAIPRHEIVVPRTARYYSVGKVDGEPRELWIVCHGYGQLAEPFLRQFESIDDGSRLIVAPEALSRFYLDPIATRRHEKAPRIGATWMTREARDTEIEDYLGYLDRVFAEVCQALAGPARRIVVVGFSQGTATVSRWLGSTSHRAHELVLWGGGIPPELDLALWGAKLHGARITLVAGESDAIVPPAATMAEGARLAAAGVDFQIVRHAGGHGIDIDTLRALAAQFAGTRIGQEIE